MNKNKNIFTNACGASCGEISEFDRNFLIDVRSDKCVINFDEPIHLVAMVISVCWTKQFELCIACNEIIEIPTRIWCAFDRFIKREITGIHIQNVY